MSFTRILAPMPANRSLAQLKTMTRLLFPTCLDVNVVTNNGNEDSLAVYITDPIPDMTQWIANVAAHVPVHPTPEETDATTQTNKASILVMLSNRLDGIDTLRGHMTTIQATSITTVPIAQTTIKQIASDFDATLLGLKQILRIMLDREDATN